MTTVTDTIDNTNTFFEPVTKTMYYFALTNLNTAQPWEATLTVGTGIFTAAWLDHVGFRSSNATTTPAPTANTTMGLRLKRGDQEVWRSPSALVTSSVAGGGATGNTAQMTIGMPPFPLRPGDQIICNGPIIDTDGTPTGDLFLNVGFVNVLV